jgi:hypothetical protein
MAAGWPTKVSYVNGDTYSASDVNDTNGTLNYIDPTSATDGQVLTRNAASGGKVKWNNPGLTYITGASFSAVASVSFPANTFTSAFNNYRIVFEVTDASALNGDFLLRLRAAGTDNTSSNYAWAIIYGYSSTVGALVIL